MDGRARAHMEGLPRFFGHVLVACPESHTLNPAASDEGEDEIYSG
jgi:hypothetical protein